MRQGIAAAARYAAIVFAAMLASACSEEPVPDPPRSTDSFEIDPQSSVIAVPIEIGLSDIRRELEQVVPRQLYSENRKDAVCVPPERIKVAFVTIKTPEIDCDIEARATRGRISLGGSGENLRVTVPVSAKVTARDIGGILKEETVTARANVRIDIRLSVSDDWQPSARTNVRYNWVDPPQIEFLGNTFDLSKIADREIAPVLKDAERLLERRIAALPLRAQVERLWTDAFTVIELNRENPPVWMQVTPQELQYGGYRVAGRSIELTVGMEAETRTFVGTRPEEPTVTALPSRAELTREIGTLALAAPVVADYDQVLPEIEQALARRSQRPFDIPAIGPVDVSFANIRFYGTEGGRVAVGADIVAKAVGSSGDGTSGTIWLTAFPVNEPGSRIIGFEDVEILGDTDGVRGDILLRVARSDAYQLEIANALTQNFESDFQGLIGKINAALEDKRVGDIMIDAQVEEMDNGTITAAGDGLYLPVEASATAAIRLSPQ